jgi:hypothetical protein
MKDRREVPRYHFNGEAELVCSGDASPVKINLNTLSVRGCRGECRDVPADTRKCELRLHWEGKEFQAEGEIMWKNPNGEIGLKFMTMDEAHLKMLRNLCADLQVQPLTVVPQDPDRVRY